MAKPDHPTQGDARRLRAAADEALERLRHLEAQQEAAQDLCIGWIDPRQVEAARERWLRAEAEAEAAANAAKGEAAAT